MLTPKKRLLKRLQDLVAYKTELGSEFILICSDVNTPNLPDTSEEVACHQRRDLATPQYTGCLPHMTHTALPHAQAGGHVTPILMLTNATLDSGGSVSPVP